MWPKLNIRQVPSALSKPAPKDTGQQESVLHGGSPDRLLSRLNWQILRPLASQLGGHERSRFLGPGMELSELRAYQPGDDIRYIDWNISARGEDVVMREAYIERALDTWLLVDVSASTNWGTALCLKRERALEFAWLSGQLLCRAGNRLGLLPFAHQPLTALPPAVGRHHLAHLLTHLQVVATQPHPGTTDLTAALLHMQSLARRRSLIILVSDFLTSQTWAAALGSLAQRHEVVVVHLFDPRECELPDIGLAIFEDPESGQQLQVDTSDAALRARFKLAAEEQKSRIQQELARYGIEQLQLGTHEEIITTFVDFLQRRRVRQRYSRQRGACSGQSTKKRSIQ